MAHCNRCWDGINEDTGQRCRYCDGLGNVPDDDDDDFRFDDDFPYTDEDNWQPCDNCDLPDACADYGCAIKAGLREDPSI